MTSGSLDKMDFKVEIENNIESNIDHCVEYNRSVISNENCDRNFIGANVETDSVPVEHCSPIYSKIEDSKVDIEKEVKIETFNHQEVGWCQTAPESLEVVDLQQIRRNENEIEIVHVENWTTNCDTKDEVDFKIKIEENPEIKIDFYHEEALQEQLVERERNIEIIDINKIGGPEGNLKGKAKNHSEKKFKCERCQFSTNYFSSLKLHQKRHEKLSKFYCGICKKGHNQTHQSNHLFTHLKEAESIRVVDSVKIYENVSVKTKAIVEIYGKECELEVYKCMECGYSSSYLSTIQNHSNEFDLHQKDFKCEFCTLNSDRKHSTFSKDFLCTKCNRKFYSLNLLKTHVETFHCIIKKFKCQLCPYRTNKEINLNHHLSAVHIEQLKFECYLCPFKTNKRWTLKTHISSVHLEDRKFECHLCNYKASQKGTLKTHISSVHLKERKFQCHLCDYKANKSSDLNRHVSTVHLKDRKLECHYCDYNTSQKRILQKHLFSVHMKERKFECHLCDYIANRRGDLNRHISTVHLKDRKFECHLCEYKANRKTDLNKHLNEVHLKTTKFECKCCTYVAYRKSLLKKHLQSKHRTLIQ